MSGKGDNNRAAWLEGPPAKCSAPPEQVGTAWRLVLLGAPGVGKGTQAALLSGSLRACHLSTGDVFRAAGNHRGIDKTTVMATAMDLMRQGHLVPDAIVWDVLNERIGCLRCQGGFVLDGFPRTVGQAESLRLLLEKEKLPLHAVLNYELPIAEIVSRLSGRRTCEECQSAFHVSSQPLTDKGICDQCGGRLYQRDDDRPEAIAVRLEDYERSTAPLIQFYRNLCLLTPMLATGSPEEIFERSLVALQERRNDERSVLAPSSRPADM